MFVAETACNIALEDTFGPTVSSACFGGFDFTLLFEETILGILPLAIAIAFAVPRISFLLSETSKVRNSWRFLLKLLACGISVALHVALLVVWTFSSLPKTRASIASTAVALGGWVVLLCLTHLEHTRSVGPSSLLSIYFAVSILFDAAHGRTLFLLYGKTPVPIVSLVALAVKIVLFTLEITPKRRLLRPQWQHVSLEETSGFFGKTFFVWLNGTFAQGYRSKLTVDSLAPIDTEILAASRPADLQEKWRRADKSSKHALLWTFAKHYKWDFALGVLPRLGVTVCSFSQPLLVERVLDFTTEPKGPNSSSIAIGLIGAYVIVYIGLAISYALFERATYRLSAKFRGSLITMIYEKTLRTSSTAISDAEAITLISSDIDRITGNMRIMHEPYSCSIEIILCLWLLHRLLGVAMIPSTVHVLACVALGFPLATAAGKAQKPWLEAIEERLAVTTKALNSMKAVKLTGLVEKVSSIIDGVRMFEIRASRRHRLLSVATTAVSYASSSLAPVWAFGLYILLAKHNNSASLTAGIAFAALSLFDLMDWPLIAIVHGTEQVKTVMSSFERIQEHLLSDEQQDARLKSVGPDSSRPSVSREISSKAALHKASPLIPELAILEEDVVAETVNVSTSYGSEEPPVLNNVSVKFDRGKTTMIFGPVGCGKSTLLKLLLGEMPHATGSTSVAFSHAAYCPQSPWITWGSIQANILGMGLWDKPWYGQVVHACALTADFAEFPNGDQTKTGTRGSRLSGGQQIRVSLARALYSRNQVLILDDVVTGLDRATERTVLDNVFGSQGLAKSQHLTVIMATNSAAQLRYADHIIVLNEKGQIAQQGNFEELSAAGSELERLSSMATSVTARPQLELNEETLKELNLSNDTEDETGERAGADSTAYLYYSRIAGWGNVLLYLFFAAVLVFGITFPSVWLQWWTNANAVHPNERIGYWLGIYGALAGITIIGSFACDGVFDLVIVPKASKTFHDILLKTTTGATTSFLTSTNVGTTINRFSEDLGLVDEALPEAIDTVVFSGMSVFVSAGLVFLGSGYVAASLPVCVGVLYLMQYFYLQTSRQMRILDIEAKAPLFSQFLETLGGIACIRAYGWSEHYMERNYEVLDKSQKPYYLLSCLQLWLGLMLDLFVAILGIMVVSFATTAPTKATGLLGVALFNIVLFSSHLQTLIREWTHLETVLGGLSRIRSFERDTPREDLTGEDGHVDKDWPSQGQVEIRSVSASYQSSLEPVLQDINISIRPGEKVALCGRTGSGKSSLISTLLRMLELDSGSIRIDGVDISTIPRNTVRGRFNTLPQEPFFLKGTVRDNIDPLRLASDERLVEVLRQMKMWDLLDSRGGLDADLSEELLSHGQRQLFCLARAIIKPSSIFIMDEATSSVDTETDEFIQSVVRQEFAGKTIIAIAHKLQSVLDFDHVAVLDKGRVVEWGNPQQLLSTAGSVFRDLYESMGSVADDSGQDQ